MTLILRIPFTSPRTLYSSMKVRVHIFALPLDIVVTRLIVYIFTNQFYRLRCSILGLTAYFIVIRFAFVESVRGNRTRRHTLTCTSNRNTRAHTHLLWRRCHLSRVTHLLKREKNARAAINHVRCHQSEIWVLYFRRRFTCQSSEYEHYTSTSEKKNPNLPMARLLQSQWTFDRKRGAFDHFKLQAYIKMPGRIVHRHCGRVCTVN